LVQAALAVKIILVLATQEVTLYLAVLLLMVVVEVEVTAQGKLAARVEAVVTVQVVLETLLAQAHRKEIMVELVELVQTTALVVEVELVL
jgi:hypothetical protein